MLRRVTTEPVRLAAAAALLLAAAAQPADARMHAPYRGHRIASSVLPLDGAGGFATPAGAYSLRKLKSTYAGPAIRLRRASDNAEQDINFLGFTSFTGAPIDTAAAAAFCAATTCTVATWYDQSGNARDGTRAAAQQPSFIFNCAGTLPCIRSSSSGQLLGAPNSAVALPVTLNGVAIRNSGAGTCVFPQHYEANNSLGATAANSWTTYSTGSVTAAAPDGAWHSAVGILAAGAGATSIRVDGGADVTGTVTASTTASSLLPFYGADTTVCSAGEVVWWSGYGLTAAEKTALIANQRNFWGF